jgi:hypothetical protein
MTREAIEALASLNHSLAKAFKLLGEQRVREFVMLTLEAAQLQQEMNICQDAARRTLLMRQFVDVIQERSQLVASSKHPVLEVV